MPVPPPSLGASRRAPYLSLEVEQPQRLQLNGRFGSQVARQGAGEVFQLLDAVGDASLQPGGGQRGFRGTGGDLGAQGSDMTPGTCSHSSPGEADGYGSDLLGLYLG